MALTPSEQLRRAFQLATLRREAEVLRTSRHWQAVIDIQERHRIRTEAENRRFDETYVTQVEAARRRLIDEAAARNRDHIHPSSERDRFNAAETLRQAQREVRLEHKSRLEAIDESERQDLAALMRRCLGENIVRGKPREAFRHAVNRRSDKERRRGMTRDRPR